MHFHNIDIRSFLHGPFKSNVHLSMCVRQYDKKKSHVTKTQFMLVALPLGSIAGGQTVCRNCAHSARLNTKQLSAQQSSDRKYTTHLVKITSSQLCFRCHFWLRMFYICECVASKRFTANVDSSLKPSNN